MASTAAPYTRRKLTEEEKRREMILMAFGIEQRELAEEIGVSKKLVHNIVRSRHRSVHNEDKILDVLNRRLPKLDRADRALLALLGVHRHVTREHMGWPVR